MAARTIRLAIAGVGNCASALLQGLQYYASTDDTTGLMVPDVGGYAVTDIEPVAAFDINAEKVGKDLADADLRCAKQCLPSSRCRGTTDGRNGTNGRPSRWRT